MYHIDMDFTGKNYELNILGWFYRSLLFGLFWLTHILYQASRLSNNCLLFFKPKSPPPPPPFLSLPSYYSSSHNNYSCTGSSDMFFSLVAWLSVSMYLTFSTLCSSPLWWTDNTRLCSSRVRWPLVPNFCPRATRKSQIFHKNPMLGTLDFTASEHWAPFSFP